MNRKTWTIGTLALAGAVAAVCGCVTIFGERTCENRVVYLEEFDHYADVVPAFTAGTKVFEWQTGSLKGLFFKPEAKNVKSAVTRGSPSSPSSRSRHIDDFAKDGMFPINPSPEGKWTLTFLGWNRAKTPSKISMVLYFGDRKNPTTAEYPFEVSKNYFQTFAVFSEGKGPLVGWNVKGPVGTDIVMDRVRVEQGVHRAYRLGDPVEWLAEVKPFTDEKLPEDFGEALAEGKTVPVDLEKNDLLFKFKPQGKDRLVFSTESGAPGGRPLPTGGGKNAAPTAKDGKNAAPTAKGGKNAAPTAKGGKNAAPTAKQAVPGRTINFNLDNEVVRLPSGKRMTLTNECVTVTPARAPWFPRLYTRPRMDRRYQFPEQTEILAALDKFPKPENKVFDLRVTRNERGENELWIDGNFALFFTNSPVVSVSGTPAFRMKTAPRPAPSLVQKLDFRAWPEGFPLWRVRENRGGCWLGVIDYSCRSCFEAMPSSCMFSVPNRPYVKARALCRVATDVPADFEPVIVARLTNYLKVSWGDEGGRTADACAKVEVRLPRPGSDDPLEKGVVRKGENLYEVTFDLPVGDMQDLLYREDSLVDREKKTHPKVDQLDFEFTGVLWRQDAYYVDRSSVPDPNAQSSVVVLSGELEAAPCDFDVVPFQTFNLYYPDETPGGRYFMKPCAPGAYAIAWSVTDETGKVVDWGRVENRSRGEVKVNSGEIKFKPLEVGLYRVRYSFTRNGLELWHHDATFGVVPKDGRKAGLESPYYAGLWGGTHGTCTDLEKQFDAFHRMGVRCSELDTYGRRPETKALAEKYRIRLGQFGYGGYAALTQPGKPLEPAIEKRAAKNREAVKKYPHTKRALIFHESGEGPFPMELVGGKTVLTEEELKRDRIYTDRAIATAKAWRAADPSVKLVMGNSTESYGLLARVFRSGMPKDLVDFVGEETVGQSKPPEETTARVAWMQRELARIYGYTVKSDCPFEWKCRTPRNFSEPDYLPAAFHIRDLLIAHALEYSLIPTRGPAGGGNDGYAQSVWSGAANGRWPLAYPGRSQLASAVLTDVLDCAKFKRLVPTGSLGVYCEEFEVKGKWVYALWTTRGETDVALDFGENAHFTEMRPRETSTADVGAVSRTAQDECYVVSACGKRSPISPATSPYTVTTPATSTSTSTSSATSPSTSTSLVVSDMPQYVVSTKPLKGAKAALQRRYPREQCSYAKSVVAVPLRSKDEIEIFDVYDKRFFRADNHFRRRGRFEVATAEDPLKGACVEIRDLLGTNGTLRTQENCTVFNFPRAQPVDGEYDTIGVWVEGNMGGGKVWLEFTDAEGEVWATTGSGGYGCNSYDWPDLMSVNFDGWHLLQFPITAKSRVRNCSVGADSWQVTRDGSGNGRIDFPIKVTGMALSNRPWNLNILEMQPTRPYVRVRDVVLMNSAAAPKLDSVFSDGFVFSAQHPTRLTGRAEPGSRVSVWTRWGECAATAGSDGRFTAVLPALGVRRDPFEVRVTDPNGTCLMRDCLAGIVLLAAGQSNMEVPVEETLNPDEEIAASQHPLIREFRVQHDYNFVPQTGCVGKWTSVSPKTAAKVGAIGLYTARLVQKGMDGIPVGIVNTSVGGSSIQPWLPIDIVKAKGYRDTFGLYDRYRLIGREGVRDLDREIRKTFLIEDTRNDGEPKGWHKGPQADWKDITIPGWLDYQVWGEGNDGAYWIARTFTAPDDLVGKAIEFRVSAIDDYDITYLNGVRIGSTGEETPNSYETPRAYRIRKGLLKKGENTIAIRIFDTAHAGGVPPGPRAKIVLADGEREFSLAGAWKTQAERIVRSKNWPNEYVCVVKVYHAASALYNAMAKPVMGAPVDAILWYQGESNAGAANYGEMLQDLIARWRADYGEGDVPFVVMQLSAFQERAKSADDVGSWTLTRQQQAEARALPNVRLVPTYDIGDANRIHPLNKQEVGRRTALVLLQDFFAPDRFRNVVAYPEAVRVVRAGNELVVTFRDATGLKTADGRAPQAFAVVGATDPKTKKAPAAWATAKIVGETIRIGIPKEISDPKRLRYGCSMNPDVNVVNGLGFPLLQFDLAVD